MRVYGSAYGNSIPNILKITNYSFKCEKKCAAPHVWRYQHAYILYIELCAFLLSYVNTRNGEQLKKSNNNNSDRTPNETHLDKICSLKINACIYIYTIAYYVHMYVYICTSMCRSQIKTFFKDFLRIFPRRHVNSD